MKRLIPILLCLVLAVGCFSGCSSKSTTSDPSTSVNAENYGDLDIDLSGAKTTQGTTSGGTAISAEPVSQPTESISTEIKKDEKYKVSIWTSGEESYLLSSILEFQKKNKNITINPINAATRTVSTLKTQMAAGKAPDIVLMDQVYVGSLFSQGLALDLSRLGANSLKSKYYDSCWNAVTSGNKIYGLPFSGNVLTMVYNKTVFKAAGVNIPKNYEEMRDISKKIKSITGKYAFLQSMPPVTNTSDVNFAAFVFSTWLWRNGGELLTADNKKAAFNSEAGINAATQMVNLVKDGTSMRFGGEGEVYNGNIGFMTLGTWVTQYMSGPNSYADIGVFEMPTLKTGVPNYSGLGLGALCITTSCKAPAAAYKFVEYYSTSMNAQKKSVTDAYGNITGMPSLKGGENEPEYKGNAVWNVFFNQFKVAKSRPSVNGWEYIELSIARAITAIAEGGDAREELNAAAEEANRILSRG